MSLEDDWEVSDEDANWDTDEEMTNETAVRNLNDINEYAKTAHNGSNTAGFWQQVYMDNTDQPAFSRKSNKYGQVYADDQLQFDPTGLSPIIEHWLKRIFGKEVLYLFPSRVQQIIIYFVLHFQFQVNNPCVSSSADLIKYEFRAWSRYFGTILFGKAFPSSVLFKYECYVRVDTIGNGIGVGIVPHDFNTFLHEHEYFPHYKTNTCIMFENGHYFGWDGMKQNTEFKIRNGDVLVIEMDMKQRTMSLKQFGGKLSFMIEKLPDDSKLAFVLDGADITVTSQTWKL